eukprot:g37419.t1
MHMTEVAVLTLKEESGSTKVLLVKVVAMGARMGPSHDCLFVGYMEHSLFQFYSGPHPQLFLHSGCGQGYWLAHQAGWLLYRHFVTML